MIEQAVGATLSAVVGLVSGWLAAYLKVRGENLATKADFQDTLRRVEENTRLVEDIKASVARRSSLDSELREAVRQFVVAAGGLLHSICWLCWDCTARRRIDAELARRYDAEAHTASPQIMAQLAVVAMLDREVHDKLAPLAAAIFAVDASVGDAVVRGETDPERGLEAFAACQMRGLDLERRFREQVTNLFGDPT